MSGPSRRGRHQQPGRLSRRRIAGEDRPAIDAIDAADDTSSESIVPPPPMDRVARVDWPQPAVESAAVSRDQDLASPTPVEATETPETEATETVDTPAADAVDTVEDRASAVEDRASTVGRRAERSPRPRWGRRGASEDAPRDVAPAADTAANPASDLGPVGDQTEAAEREARRDPDVPARSVSLRIYAVVAAVAVILAVVGVGYGAREVLSARSDDGTDSAAVSAAVDSTSQIFSYDYSTVKTHLGDVASLMTPSFATEFESVGPALTRLAPQRQIQVQSTVRDAAVVPCPDDCPAGTVRVLVFFDALRTTGPNADPAVFANRVTVDMREVDGSWKVDDIRALS